MGGPRTMNFMWKQFGDDLRKARMARGYGLRECARELKIDYSICYRAEHGKPVTVPFFILFCDWMGSNPRSYADKRADQERGGDLWR